MAYPPGLAPPFHYGSNGDAHPLSAPPMNMAQSNGAGPSGSFVNPNVTSNTHVYMAVYSSIPVFEMMCRGISVMRRRSDSFMNATQLLKVAGIEKSQRTKILDRDIVAHGEFEKIQGGYGKYQGTWIPFHRARDLAQQYGVQSLIAPLLDYMPPPPPNQSPNGAPQSTLLGADTFQTGGVPGRTIPRQPTPKRERDDAMAIDPALNKRARTEEAPAPAPSVVDGVQPSSKPLDTSINEDPERLNYQREALQTLFMHEQAPNGTSLPADIEVDLTLDHEGHTALHWAAGMGRLDVARILIQRGATVTRGNATGETPLMRAVVCHNSYELDVFPALLQLLAPSLRTIDDAGRTALHHAIGVAGITGRAASARYYVECILEYIAKQQAGAFRELIDHADKQGNSALNIAARVGNAVLAKMLLEVGANPQQANKVGLRPCDFGLDALVRCTCLRAQTRWASLKGTQPASSSEPATSTSASTNAVPPMKTSQDVLAQLAKMLNTLDEDHAAELKHKSDGLGRARANLRDAAAQLAKCRRQLSESSRRANEVTAARQRIANYERALQEEDRFDWTGRTEIDGQPSRPAAGAAFAFLGTESTLAVNMPNLADLPAMETDPPLPTGSAPHQLTQLRRLVNWYGRTTSLLGQRIARAEGTSTENEDAYRKLVARSCRVPVDRVDAMLEQLVVAMESEGPEGLEASRLGSVLTKVRAGAAAAAGV